MSIISKETFDKFTPEEKARVRKEYADNIKRIESLGEDCNSIDLQAVNAEYEALFGKENLEPEYTFKDIHDKLYAHKCNIIQFMTTTSIRHEKKINAINNLLEVAKFLNGDWVPDEDETKWFIRIENNQIIVDWRKNLMGEIVYFRSEKIARQAISILGEETIRMALTINY